MATDAKDKLCREIARKMGDAGYCNYDACLEFIHEAYDAGAREQREICKCERHEQT